MSIALYDLSRDALDHIITDWGYPRFRADQIWRWLYGQFPVTLDDMHNLPGDLHEQLASETELRNLSTVRTLSSSDGMTQKYLFRLPDSQLVETVLMEYNGHRRTACISTQAGCAMGCVFCATGHMGLARNLTTGEIVEQAIHVARILKQSDERLSNVVLMGMGEPFHNYDPSLAAIRRIIDPDALGIGQRHVTVSTVGLIPAIRRFADEGLQVRLAISLHAATDDERSALIPLNQRWNLTELLDAVRYYIAKAGRRVTFEWALIDGTTDTPEQAHALGSLLQGVLAHVNAIPLNPTGGYSGKPPSPDRMNRFAGIVESYGVPTTIRVRRGIDINAGCGQLKADVTKKDVDRET